MAIGLRPARARTVAAIRAMWLALALALAFVLATPHAATSLELETVAPGLFVHRGQIADFSKANDGDISNMVAIVGEDAVAVVDTSGSLRVARRFRDALRARTDLPVRYVINSHFHPDHIMGTSVFTDEGAILVGHRGLERAIAERGAHYLARLGEILAPGAMPTKLVMPDLAVEGLATLDLGGRTLWLQAWPTGHSAADLTVFDARTGILVAGDLLFASHLPVVDGSLNGWLAWPGSRLVDELPGPISGVIAGHGPAEGPALMPWPAATAAQTAYLSSLRSSLRAAIEQGLDLGEAAATIAPDASHPWQLIDVFHARNVVTGYTELEWE